MVGTGVFAIVLAYLRGVDLRGRFVCAALGLMHSPLAPVCSSSRPMRIRIQDELQEYIQNTQAAPDSIAAPGEKREEFVGGYLNAFRKPVKKG